MWLWSKDKLLFSLWLTFSSAIVDIKLSSVWIWADLNWCRKFRAHFGLGTITAITRWAVPAHTKPDVISRLVAAALGKHRLSRSRKLIRISHRRSRHILIISHMRIRIQLRLLQPPGCRNAVGIHNISTPRVHTLINNLCRLNEIHLNKVFV